MLSELQGQSLRRLQQTIAEIEHCCLSYQGHGFGRKADPVSETKDWNHVVTYLLSLVLRCNYSNTLISYRRETKTLPQKGK